MTMIERHLVTLEFDKIRALLRQHAGFSASESLVEALTPTTDLSDLTRHRDLLADLADLECKIDHRILAECQANSRVHRCLEPGQPGADFVVSSGKAQCLVFTSFVCLCGP